MMHGIKIMVGDVIELAPHKRATIDDFDLEKCTVLELNEDTAHIKVVFNKNNVVHEKLFANDSIIDWFSVEHVIDVERDYKILNITDNIDMHSGQPVTIAVMAKVIKQISHSSKGYTLIGAPDKADTDTFIFIGLNYRELMDYKGTTNRISLSNFRVEDAVINNTNKHVFYSKTKIVDVEDIFTD